MTPFQWQILRPPLQPFVIHRGHGPHHAVGHRASNQIGVQHPPERSARNPTAELNQLQALLKSEKSERSAQQMIHPWRSRTHISPRRFRLKSPFVLKDSIDVTMCYILLYTSCYHLKLQKHLLWPTMSQPPAAPHIRAVCMKKPEPRKAKFRSKPPIQLRQRQRDCSNAASAPRLPDIQP